MDNPEQPRQPRWFVRWLSPLRWRFWTLTLPALGIVILAILFWWPGLTFRWRVNDSCYLVREDVIWGKKDAAFGGGWNWSELRAGPLALFKADYLGADGPGGERGFVKRHSPASWRFDYLWESGDIGFSVARSLKQATR
jgi:hypothetical protein